MILHTYTFLEFVKYNGEDGEEDEYAEVAVDIELHGAVFTPSSFDEPCSFDYEREVFCPGAIKEIEALFEDGFEFLNGRNNVDDCLNYALDKVLDNIDSFNTEDNWSRY